MHMRSLRAVLCAEMHVLQVTPYFPPTWAFGGIPRIVDGLSRALVASGVETTVITTDAHDAEGRAETAEQRDHFGVTVLTVPNWSNTLAYRHQLFLPRGVIPALNTIQRPVDLLHLHGHRHLLNNAALQWARRHSIPYVMTANGTLHRHERKTGLKWFWDRAVSGWIPGQASRCIAVSEADHSLHRLHGIPNERISVIPNA